MDNPVILKFSHYLPTCLWRWNRQSVPKCRHIKFRRRGITQKKTYNIQNTAKVWNQEYLGLHIDADRKEFLWVYLVEDIPFVFQDPLILTRYIIFTSICKFRKYWPDDGLFRPKVVANFWNNKTKIYFCQTKYIFYCILIFYGFSFEVHQDTLLINILFRSKNFVTRSETVSIMDYMEV